MPISIYQIQALMNNMFTYVPRNYNSSTPILNGVSASELPVAGDNINNHLNRYPGVSARWASANYESTHSFGSAQWTQNVGGDAAYGGTFGWAYRANGGYYTRSVGFTNEGNNWGYVGSLASGYFTNKNQNPPYGVDTMGASVDYDSSLLGHGTSGFSPYPFPLSPTSQFRDPNNLPVDGTAYISSVGSAYSRNQYLFPVYQTLLINSSGSNTVGSGDITFLLEQRPSHNTIINSRSLDTSAYGEIFVATQQRRLNRRRLNIFYGRIYGGINENIYVYPYEEDGSLVGVANTTLPISPTNPILGCYDAQSLNTTTGTSSSRPTGLGDQRIRERAMFYINEEYFGIVQETKVAILSNKSAAPIPLIFFDLADTWGSAAGSRCAGVCVAGTGAAVKIYFLSEAGSLLVYDFTVDGGAITSLTAAPSLATGEAYGAIETDGTNVYALNGCWSASPYVTTTGSGRIGVTAYNISAGTWGTSNNSAILGRHNTRALDEMILLRNGYLALLVEKITDTDGSIANFDATNIDWQLMIYDTTTHNWNTAQIAPTGLQFGTGATRWGVYPQGSLHDVAAGVLLVQSNWYNNALWSFDVSGSAASISNSNATAIGYSQANSIYPSGSGAPTVAVTPLIIRKSKSDDRTLFWHNWYNAASTGGSQPFLMFLAPPSFNWTSGTLSVLYDNAVTPSIGYEGGAVTISFNKDCLSHGNLSVADAGFGSTADSAWNFTGFFNDCYMPIFNVSWSISLHSMIGDGASTSVIFIPTYWKQVVGTPVLADNWADANAYPFIVPSTVTPITLPYGLKAQFGPGTGNTYVNGEYHSFNATYGYIKYQRKARYAWSMFAGQTFQNTETRSIAALTAITPSLAEGNWTSSIAGPVGAASGVYNTRTEAKWSSMSSGTPQNTAAALTINFTNSPNLTTLVNPPGTGTITCDQTTPYQSAALAFDGNPGDFWRSAGNGTHWIQIDLGATTTVNSYSLRFNSTEVPASWTLSGSPNGTTWTTVDSQTVPSSLYEVHAFDLSSTASYRYFRLTCSSSNNIQVGSFRLFSAALGTSINFSEIQFMNGFERGLTFQVNTGSGLTTITPIWRAHNGGTFCFPRQTGVQSVVITAQYGANEFIGGVTTGNIIMGPFRFIDYGTQVQMDAARLGNPSLAGQSPTNAGAASFESNCIGIAADALTLTIDGDSAFIHNPYSPQTAIWNFYDWATVPVGQFKTHPFWGFIILPGGGANGQLTTYAGTTATVVYTWGLRV